MLVRTTVSYVVETSVILDLLNGRNFWLRWPIKQIYASPWRFDKTDTVGASMYDV